MYYMHPVSTMSTMCYRKLNFLISNLTCKSFVLYRACSYMGMCAYRLQETHWAIYHHTIIKDFVYIGTIHSMHVFTDCMPTTSKFIYLGRPSKSSIHVNTSHATCQAELQPELRLNASRIEYIFQLNTEDIYTEIRSWEDTVPLPPCTDGNVNIEVTCWGKENDTNFESPPSDTIKYNCLGEVHSILKIF